VNKKAYLLVIVILIAAGSTSAYAINITLGGTVDITQILNMMGNRITNVGNPTLSSDAATKGYVDSAPGTDDQIAKFDGANWVCTADNAGITQMYTLLSAQNVPGGNDTNFIILCDESDKAMGGGYFSNTPDMIVYQNLPTNAVIGEPENSATGWAVAGKNTGVSVLSLNVYVICADFEPLR